MMPTRPRALLNIEHLEDRTTPALVMTDTIALGTGAGGEPEVRVLNLDGSERTSFLAYDSSFRGGVRVAVGDLNGDGLAEIVTAPGTGGGPQVKVFDGSTGREATSFFAYDPRFLGGVSVAVGVLQGRPVIVTGAGLGGGPQVNVFLPNGQLIQSFMAYSPSFQGGVSVAVGDVLGNGAGAIITGAGPGGGPQVNVFDANGVLKYSTFPYPSNFRSGVTVAAGDVGGIGRDVVITGAGPGGGPQVNIIDPVAGQVLQSFFAYDSSFRGGVDVSVVPGEGGRDLLVTAPGPGGGPDVRVYQVPQTTVIRQTIYDPWWGGWYSPLAFGSPFLFNNFWGAAPFFGGGLNFGFGFGLWQPYMPSFMSVYSGFGSYWPTAAPVFDYWSDAGYSDWGYFADPVYVDPDPMTAPGGWFFDDSNSEWYFDDTWVDTGSYFTDDTYWYDTGYYDDGGYFGYDDTWYDTGYFDDYYYDDGGWYDTGWDYGWDDYSYGYDDWGYDDYGWDWW